MLNIFHQLKLLIIINMAITSVSKLNNFSAKYLRSNVLSAKSLSVKSPSTLCLFCQMFIGLMSVIKKSGHGLDAAHKTNVCEPTTFKIFYSAFDVDCEEILLKFLRKLIDIQCDV